MKTIKYFTLLTFCAVQILCLNAEAQDNDLDLQQRVEALEKQLKDNTDSKLKQKNKELKSELKQKKAEVADLKKEKDRLLAVEEAYNQLKTRFEAAESSQGDQQKANEQLTQDLATAQQKASLLEQEKTDLLDSVITLNNTLSGLNSNMGSATSDLQAAQQQLRVANGQITTLRSDKAAVDLKLRQAEQALEPSRQRNQQLANFLLSDLQESALSIVSGTQFSKDLPMVKALTDRIQNIKSQNLLGNQANGRLDGLERKLKNYEALADAMQTGNRVLAAVYSSSSTTAAMGKLNGVDREMLGSDQKSAYDKLSSLLRNYCAKNREARAVIVRVNKFSITFQTPSEATKDLNAALNSSTYRGYPFIRSQLESKKKSSNIARNYNPFPSASCN